MPAEETEGGGGGGGASRLTKVGRQEEQGFDAAPARSCRTPEPIPASQQGRGRGQGSGKSDGRVRRDRGEESVGAGRVEMAVNEGGSQVDGLPGESTSRLASRS